MSVHHAAPAWPQYVFPLLIAGIVLLLRLRRMSQLRPLKLERLWIVPALYLVIVGVSFAATPPTPLGWLWSAVGLVAGAALGWQRGKTMRIHVDPATHQLNQRSSPAGMLFIVALIAVKSLARAGGGAMHLNVANLTDALLALALGTFTAMRVEMFLRAKRMLGEARAV